MNTRAIWLIAKSVLIEAVRRKEIYAIVLVATSLIVGALSLDFFHLEGLHKFYRDVALKLMSIATALTVIVLAARQLPREFETRTIYPLLAKPISRLAFFTGKLLGVMLVAAFCFSLFMALFVIGTYLVGGSIPWGIFLQYIYLQMVMMLILATLSFWLSMVLNLDAAITVAVLLYALAATYTSVTTLIYDTVGAFEQKLLIILTYAIPQLTLFDLSAKATHSEAWDVLSVSVLGQLTLYGSIFALFYFSLGMFSFSRRAL